MNQKTQQFKTIKTVNGIDYLPLHDAAKFLGDTTDQVKRQAINAKARGDETVLNPEDDFYDYSFSLDFVLDLKAKRDASEHREVIDTISFLGYASCDDLDAIHDKFLRLDEATMLPSLGQTISYIVGNRKDLIQLMFSADDDSASVISVHDFIEALYDEAGHRDTMSAHTLALRVRDGRALLGSEALKFVGVNSFGFHRHHETREPLNDIAQRSNLRTVEVRGHEYALAVDVMNVIG